MSSLRSLVNSATSDDDTPPSGYQLNELARILNAVDYSCFVSSAAQHGADCYVYFRYRAFEFKNSGRCTFTWPGCDRSMLRARWPKAAGCTLDIFRAPIAVFLTFLSERSKASLEDCRSIEELLIRRADKSEPTIKLKALKVIKYVAQNGRAEFRTDMQRNNGVIKACTSEYWGS